MEGKAGATGALIHGSNHHEPGILLLQVQLLLGCQARIQAGKLGHSKTNARNTQPLLLFHLSGRSSVACVVISTPISLLAPAAQEQRCCHRECCRHPPWKRAARRRAGWRFLDRNAVLKFKTVTSSELAGSEWTQWSVRGGGSVLQFYYCFSSVSLELTRNKKVNCARL
jgi:hypothetical protein